MKTTPPRLAALDSAYAHVQAALEALRGARPSPEDEDACRRHTTLRFEVDDLLGLLAAEMARIDGEERRP